MENTTTNAIVTLSAPVIETARNIDLQTQAATLGATDDVNFPRYAHGSRKLASANRSNLIAWRANCIANGCVVAMSTFQIYTNVISAGLGAFVLVDEGTDHEAIGQVVERYGKRGCKGETWLDIRTLGGVTVQTGWRSPLDRGRRIARTLRLVTVEEVERRFAAKFARIAAITGGVDVVVPVFAPDVVSNIPDFSTITMPGENGGESDSTETN